MRCGVPTTKTKWKLLCNDRNGDGMLRKMANIKVDSCLEWLGGSRLVVKVGKKG